VYVATDDPQTITQFNATVRTADEKADAAGGSTVDLKLTAIRLLEGVQDPPLLRAISVLSPSTLLLAHYDRPLELLTHTAPVSAGHTAADRKLTGPASDRSAEHRDRCHWNCCVRGGGSSLRQNRSPAASLCTTPPVDCELGRCGRIIVTGDGPMWR
jgi:hypothetical protein